MQKEVQQQFKSEFKQPLVFICVALIVIGFLVFIFLGMTVSNF